jgi:ABC-type dipeptide/oligopeptide/nickel transport system permease subunit
MVLVVIRQLDPSPPITSVAHIIRSSLLAVREELCVEAAVIMGVSPIRIVLRQILPNVMPFVFVVARC